MEQTVHRAPFDPTKDTSATEKFRGRSDPEVDDRGIIRPPPVAAVHPEVLQKLVERLGLAAGELQERGREILVHAVHVEEEVRADAVLLAAGVPVGGPGGGGGVLGGVEGGAVDRGLMIPRSSTSGSERPRNFSFRPLSIPGRMW